MEQKVLKGSETYSELDAFLDENKVKSIFLVCDSALKFLRIDRYFSELESHRGIRVVYFSDFTPNPLYESVETGVDLFNSENCDIIIAVGGGSALDVAKCIKLYSNMDSGVNYLKQEIVPNDIPFLAIPTTAGTGSEATRYAVIYYNGEKQSVADYSCIPETVLMDPDFLVSLPEYQKKATMLDAFCHAVESFWSVNSTDESKKYSREAIRIIIENKDAYLNKDYAACEKMLKAANFAGKAINITQTTAGHAMCYKLTSLYSIAHGHAASLCVSELFPYMVKNTDRCIDPRGEEYLKNTFGEIAEAFGADSVEDGVKKTVDFISSVGLDAPENVSRSDIDILKNSVNPVRLKNNPVALSTEVIEKLYKNILGIGD